MNNTDDDEIDEMMFSFIKPNSRKRKCKECDKLAIWKGKYEGKMLYFCDRHCDKFKRWWFNGRE